MFKLIYFADPNKINEGLKFIYDTNNTKFDGDLLIQDTEDMVVEKFPVTELYDFYVHKGITYGNFKFDVQSGCIKYDFNRSFAPYKESYLGGKLLVESAPTRGNSAFRITYGAQLILEFKQGGMFENGKRVLNFIGGVPFTECDTQLLQVIKNDKTGEFDFYFYQLWSKRVFIASIGRTQTGTLGVLHLYNLKGIAEKYNV